MVQTTKYAAILDAGSSGTRPYIYSWQSWEAGKGNPPPILKLEFVGTKTKKGIHKMAAADVPGSLADLFTELRHKIGDDLPVALEKVPVYILATAGVRDLGGEQLSKLIKEVDSYLKYLYVHPRLHNISNEANEVRKFLFPIHPDAEDRFRTLLQEDINKFATIHNKITQLLTDNPGTVLKNMENEPFPDLLRRIKEFLDTIPQRPLLSARIAEIRQELRKYDGHLIKFLINTMHYKVYEQIQHAHNAVRTPVIREKFLENVADHTVIVPDATSFNPNSLNAEIINAVEESTHPRLKLDELIMQVRQTIRHIRKLIPGDTCQSIVPEDIARLRSAVNITRSLPHPLYNGYAALDQAMEDCLNAETNRNQLFQAIKEYAEGKSFRVVECKAITGEEEGLYGWIAASYMRGNLSSYGPKTYHTAGYVEMGGASAQIAFQPTSQEKSKYAGMLWRVDVGGKKFDMYLKTLPLGSIKSKGHHDNIIEVKRRAEPQLQDPCNVDGFHTAGEKRFHYCQQAAQRIVLNLWRPYEYPIPDQYPKERYVESADFLEGAMEIDFQKSGREFIGGATFWDVTRKTFGRNNTTFGPWELLLEAQSSYAEVATAVAGGATPGETETLGHQNWAWFCAGFVQSVLYRGFGFPAEYGTGVREFTFQPYAGGDMELTWTIGRILLHATKSEAPKMISCTKSVEDNLAGDNGVWQQGIPAVGGDGQIELWGVDNQQD